MNTDDEPTNNTPLDPALAEFEAEVNEGMYASDHDALHGWMAVTQLPVTLDLRQVVEQVRPEVGTFCDVPWVLDHMSEHEYGTDEAHRFIDKMGDASKVLLAAVQAELTSRGMGNAHIFVYLPCHKGYGIILFSEEHGPLITVF